MKSAQIALVEDNPGDVILVSKALKENAIEHSLMRFESGVDAVRALCAEDKAKRFVPDAILLDLNTPRSDGFEVLQRFRGFSQFSHVPIATLTSSRDQKDKYRDAMQGARYIEKPSQLDEFLKSIGQAVKEMLRASPS